MLRPFSEQIAGTRQSLLVLIVGFGLLAGCASQTADRSASRAAPDPSAMKTAGGAAERNATSALVEVEPEVGFTVTEVVTIPSAARADHRTAIGMLAAEDYAGGIALLREVIEQVPDATGPLIDLGIAYRRAGELEAALESLTQALELTPDHPVAHNELGIVYRNLGRFAEARASYEQALAIYPGFHFARRNLAVVCDLYLADLTCALEQYQIYRASVAEDREVDIWIGDIQNRVGDAG